MPEIGQSPCTSSCRLPRIRTDVHLLDIATDLSNGMHADFHVMILSIRINAMIEGTLSIARPILNHEAGPFDTKVHASYLQTLYLVQIRSRPCVGAIVICGFVWHCGPRFPRTEQRGDEPREQADCRLPLYRNCLPSLIVVGVYGSSCSASCIASVRTGSIISRFHRCRNQTRNRPRGPISRDPGPRLHNEKMIPAANWQISLQSRVIHRTSPNRSDKDIDRSQTGPSVEMNQSVRGEMKHEMASTPKLQL